MGIVIIGEYMAFAFKNQLRLAVPISKKTCGKRTLDASVDRNNVIDTVKFWFPVFDKIILNARQNKLRAYHALPKHFLLFYDEQKIEDGKQKWKTVYKIKVFRDCSMSILDCETGELYTPTQ